MSEGSAKVDAIMGPLSSHIKEGADPKTNKQHYNYVYEAIWGLIDERQRERAEAIRLVENIVPGLNRNAALKFLKGGS